ncbi:hypothetical protein JCM6882_008888 [Rhodosporidiobolus microsporus]
MSTASSAPAPLEKDVEMKVEPALAPAATAEQNEASTKPEEAPKPVPEGFVVHTESTTSILFAAPPSSSSDGPAPVFLNPVQEYNRDLSVVAIRTWGAIWGREKSARWEEGLKRKRERNGKKRAAAGGEGAEGGKGKRRRGKKGEAVPVAGEEGPEAEEKGEVKVDGEGEKDAERLKDDAKLEEAETKVEAAPAEAETPAEPSTSTLASTSAPSTSTTPSAAPASAPAPAPTEPFTPRAPVYKFSLLEALSATGLRAIRYAKELPMLKYVIANDLSASAVLDIKRNIDYNGLAPLGLNSLPGAPEGGFPEGEEPKAGGKWSKAAIEEAREGKVRVNQGDACVYMYQHRGENDRFDCIDLDPYGSAVPFLDAAMNAIQDGGLMCVTCTDVGVLAGHNYPEKAFSAYGGLCANAEYSHEVGLRLVLHSLATTAARYGRYIEPQLSLSIDFYVRLFIRVKTAPKEVKALASKTSLVYYCHSCQTPHFQPLGRVSEKPNLKDPKSVNTSYHIPAGPPKETAGAGGKCGECGGTFHIAGPLWSAPIHNKDFVAEMLEHVEANEGDFKTSDRIKGMLTVAKSEVEMPLYFSPAKMASLFHATCPTIQTVGSALLNAGYKISRSHAVAGSIKTDAPRKFVHDIVREWIKVNPVAMKNVKDGSPAKRLLEREQTHEVSLAPHAGTAAALLDNVKLVRYQMNPQANWGPARAAVRGAPKQQ